MPSKNFSCCDLTAKFTRKDRESEDAPFDTFLSPIFDNTLSAVFCAILSGDPSRNLTPESPLILACLERPFEPWREDPSPSWGVSRVSSCDAEPVSLLGR